MSRRPIGVYRPTAARKRLMKDQERADDYKEWIAAKAIQLEQEKQLGNQPALGTAAEKRRLGNALKSPA